MVLYSVLLFGLATVVVGGIYAGLAQELRDQDVSRTEEMVRLFQPDEDGPIIGVPVEVEFVDQLAVFEREVNQQALKERFNPDRKPNFKPKKKADDGLVYSSASMRSKSHFCFCPIQGGFWPLRIKRLGRR